MSSFTLSIRASPNSRKPGRITSYGDRLKVSLRSAPEDGKANSELIELLAKEHEVSPSAVRIVSGYSCRDKTVRISLEKPCTP